MNLASNLRQNGFDLYIVRSSLFDNIQNLTLSGCISTPINLVAPIGSLFKWRGANGGFAAAKIQLLRVHLRKPVRLNCMEDCLPPPKERLFLERKPLNCMFYPIQTQLTSVDPKTLTSTCKIYLLRLANRSRLD